MKALREFFGSSGFMPHGHCFLWKPGVLWLHVVSDLLIVAAYYSIPLTLIYFVSKRRDIAFNWVFRLFAAFIFWCGTTHLMAVWVMWNPNYWIDGGVKAVTAAVSVVTAVALWPLLPKALKLPSPAQVQAVNRRLEEQIGERIRAETELWELNHNLERRVEERTRALEEANRGLQRQKREFEQFAYVVSHDLREPLRAMAGYAYLLERGGVEGLTDKQVHYLRDITEASKRMDRLISDLLAYARAGRMESEPEPVDVHRIVREVLGDLQGLIAEKKAGIRFDALPTIGAHGSLLHQVFQNLISNALKYGGGKGAPSIQIRGVQSGAYWRFEVEDDGPGIKEEDRERVFKLFQRLQAEDGSEGVGLGLAITRKIVESYGGRIWIESKPTQGCKFCFILPVLSVRGEGER